MCLTLKDSDRKAHRARKDIECYKLVLENKQPLLYGARTPYTNAPIKTDILKGDLPFEAYVNKHADKSTENFFHLIGRTYVNGINSGAIHTFRTYEGAEKELVWLKTFIESNSPKIYRCVIPKGTLYYKGTYDRDPAYASMKIYFKERIPY